MALRRKRWLGRLSSRQSSELAALCPPSRLRRLTVLLCVAVGAVTMAPANAGARAYCHNL